MANVDYKLVYKDGANTGAPLVTLRYGDTKAGLGSPDRMGDLAYAVDTNRLYVWLGDWYEITTMVTPNFSEHVWIKKFFPTLILDNLEVVAKSRIQAQGNRILLMHNYWWNGSTFVKDDTSQGANILLINPNAMEFWSHPVGGSIARVFNINSVGGSIGLSGGVFEFNRNVFMGQLIEPGWSAGTVSATAPMTVAPNFLNYAYSLVGQTHTSFVWMEGSTGGTASNAIFMVIPGGNVASRWSGTECFINTPGYRGGGLVYVGPGGSNFTIVKDDGSNFGIGTIQIIFNIAMTV